MKAQGHVKLEKQPSSKTFSWFIIFFAFGTSSTIRKVLQEMFLELSLFSSLDFKLMTLVVLDIFFRYLQVYIQVMEKFTQSSNNSTKLLRFLHHGYGFNLLDWIQIKLICHNSWRRIV